MSSDSVESGPKTYAKRPSPFAVAAATLLAVVGASTLAQAVTWASYGIPVELSGEWSAGLLAVGAAGWLAATCKSWVAWRRWVWLPVGVGVVLSAVLISVTVAAERAAAEQVAAEQARMCSAAEGELARLTETHDALAVEANKLAGPSPWLGGDVHPPSPPSPGMTDWAEVAGTGSYTAAWNYYVAYGGPQLETDIAELQGAIETECG